MWVYPVMTGAPTPIGLAAMGILANVKEVKEHVTV